MILQHHPRIQTLKGNVLIAKSSPPDIDYELPHEDAYFLQTLKLIGLGNTNITILVISIHPTWIHQEKFLLLFFQVGFAILKV